VIGHRQSGHFQFRGALNQGVEPVCSIEQTELGMTMQMDKIAAVRHVYYLPRGERIVEPVGKGIAMLFSAACSFPPYI
jgi:hypothetical protein